MTHEQSEKNPQLEALLEGVTDEVERTKIQKAWQALGGMVGSEAAAPSPCSALENVFRGVDEELGDDELELIAAAGIPGVHRVGNDDPNMLFGTAGDDLLEGLGGDDRLYGGTGADTLDGGTGNDFLMGGGDGDTYVFGPDSGHDTIAGFNMDMDSLDFGDVDPSTIFMRYENGNTIITFGDSSVTVLGVNMLADTDDSDGTTW